MSWFPCSPPLTCFPFTHFLSIYSGLCLPSLGYTVAVLHAIYSCNLASIIIIISSVCSSIVVSSKHQPFLCIFKKTTHWKGDRGFFFLIKNGLLATTSIRLLLLHRLCLVRCCIIVLLFSCHFVYMHLCIHSEKAFATVCEKIITKCLCSSSLLMHSLSQVQRGHLTFSV